MMHGGPSKYKWKSGHTKLEINQPQSSVRRKTIHWTDENEEPSNSNKSSSCKKNATFVEPLPRSVYDRQVELAKHNNVISKNNNPSSVQRPETLSQRVHRLTQTLDSERAELANLAKSKREMQSQLVDAHVDVEEAQRSRHALELNVQRKESTIEELQARIEYDEQERRRLNIMEQDYENRIENMEERIERSTSNKVRLEATVARLQVALDHSRGEVADLERVKRKLCIKVKESRERLRSYETLEGNFARLQTDLQHMGTRTHDAELSVNSLLEKNATIDARLTTTLEELAEEKAAAKRADRQREGAYRELARLQESLEEANRTLSRQREAYERSESECSRLQNALLERSRDAEESCSAVLRLQKDLEVSAERTRELSSSLAEVNHNLKHHDTLTSDHAALREKFRVTESEVERLRRDLSTAEADANVLHSDNDRIRKRTADLERAISMGEQTEQVQKERLRKLEASFNSSMEELRERCSRLSSDLDVANSDVERTVRERDRLSSELIARENDIALARSLHSEASAQRDALQSQSAHLTSTLAKSRAEYDAEVSRLRAELQDVESRLTTRRKAAEDEAQVQILQSNALKTEVDTLTRRLGDEARRQHEEIETLRRNDEVERKDLSRSFADSRGALEASEKARMRLQRQVDQQAESMRRLEASKSSEAEEIRRTLSVNNQKLQEALDNELRGRRQATSDHSHLEGVVRELEIALAATDRALKDQQSENSHLQVASKRGADELLELRAEVDRARSHKCPISIPPPQPPSISQFIENEHRELKQLYETERKSHALTTESYKRLEAEAAKLRAALRNKRAVEDSERMAWSRVERLSHDLSASRGASGGTGISSINGAGSGGAAEAICLNNEHSVCGSGVGGNMKSGWPDEVPVRIRIPSYYISDAGARVDEANRTAHAWRTGEPIRNATSGMV